jgi:hypothetical protein
MIEQLKPLNSFDDPLEELQYRISKLKEFKINGRKGYGPCLEFYQKLEKIILEKD